ncbi:MAG: alanine racemase [Pseudonocardiales bacterium]|nr:alanine racemase [Pseudonocardiales bacterium]
MSELPSDFVTPGLVVDRDVIENSIASMQASLTGRGLTVRPHAKTHKCGEIARRQLAAGAVGLTVATVAEAEIFAAAGCADLFIAFPLWVDRQLANRLNPLTERGALRVGVESAEGAEQLGRLTRGIEVLVEIDSGHHRTGVLPDQAAPVALAAARAGLTVRGVFTFPGHSYGPGRAASAAHDEVAALEQAAEAVRAAGLEIDVISGGSTPTAGMTASALTEARPGVYVFNDAQQLELGTCSAADVALVASATVISRRPDRIVLNVGSKVLGADRPSWTTGFGRLPDHPEARITALSEHHATVTWPTDTTLPDLGSVLRVMPNHVCTAVNLADELTVVSEGRVVDRWPVIARNANT